MKSMIIALALLILSAPAFAQPKDISNMFDKYAGKAGFVHVNLTDAAAAANMFRSDGLKDVLKDVKNVRILTLSEAKKAGSSGNDFRSDLQKLGVESGFKEYLAVDADGTRVRIYIRSNGNDVGETYLTVTEENTAVLIWINGHIELDKVKEIGKAFGSKGGKKKK